MEESDPASDLRSRCWRRLFILLDWGTVELRVRIYENSTFLVALRPGVARPQGSGW